MKTDYYYPEADSVCSPLSSSKLLKLWKEFRSMLLKFDTVVLQLNSAFFWCHVSHATTCLVVSGVWFFATLWTVAPPGSSVHRILQTRILEWIAMHSFRGSSRPRDQTCISCVSCMVGRFFITELLGKPSNLSIGA